MKQLIEKFSLPWKEQGSHRFDNAEIVDASGVLVADNISPHNAEAIVILMNAIPRITEIHSSVRLALQNVRV